MAKIPSSGFDRIQKASRYSWQGLRACYRHEAAFRQEVWCALVLLPLGLILGETGAEKAMLAGSLLLVLIVEVLNSAIEAAVDLVSADWQELAGRAKDMGSAAVALALALLAVVWLLVLLF